MISNLPISLWFTQHNLNKVTYDPAGILKEIWLKCFTLTFKLSGSGLIQQAQFALKNPLSDSKLCFCSSVFGT